MPQERVSFNQRLFGKAGGPKASPSEIGHFLNKSKSASEYGQKAVRFMEAKMSISYVKVRPIMAIGRIWIMKIQSIGI
jgi:hypothetical protein